MSVGGAWAAQSVKHLTLDFGSGHDLTVSEIEHSFGLCTDSMEPACDSLSSSQNKLNKVKYFYIFKYLINMFLNIPYNNPDF